MTTYTTGQQAALDNIQRLKGQTWQDYVATGANAAPVNYGGQMIPAYVWNDPSFQAAVAQNGDNPTVTGQMQQLWQQLETTHTSGDQASGQAALDKARAAAQTNLEFHMAHPSGNDAGWLDNFMEFAIPAAVTMMVGGSMGGLFDGAASAAGGTDALGASVAGDTGMGLGAQAINAGTLQDLGFLNGIGGADAAAGAAGGLGGIASGGSGVGGAGSMIGIEGGAPAVVSVGPPAATGGLGSGAAYGAGAGAVGLGALATDTGALQQVPGINQGGVPINESDLPGAPVVPLNPMPPVDPVADGAANLPGSVPPVGGGTPTTPPGSIPGAGGIPGLIPGLGGLIGANRDRITNQQDQDYWQHLMDQMMGMYKPGTAEADQMQSSMDAKDAAAGRNSQYGTRAVNLGAALAGQRANIMTSPTFYKMGEAARGHYDNSLNSLFSQLGSGGNIQQLLGLGQNLFGGSTTPPVG